MDDVQLGDTLIQEVAPCILSAGCHGSSILAGCDADPWMGQAAVLQECSCLELLSPHPVPIWGLAATWLRPPFLILRGTPQPPKRQNSRAISWGD